MNPQIPQGLGLQTEPFEVVDFSGGVTDFYIGGPVNKAKTLDNFVIVKSGDLGKPVTRPGSELYDADHPQVTAGAIRIGTLKTFEDVLLVQAEGKFFYSDSGWQNLQGPSSNDVFPATASADDVVSLATWNHHLLVASSAYFKPQKIFPNASGDLQVRTAGLPAFPSAPTVTPASAGSGASHIFAFAYSYTYQVGSVTFEDVGPVTYVAQTGAASPAGGGGAWTVTGIPTLSNGSDDNYDTASSDLKIKVWRTTDGGGTFFFAGWVTNGTTTFSDTATDADLLAYGVTLYTDGGVPDNDPPPACKLVHVAGDTAYYANVMDGSQARTNRLMQSSPGDIDSVPADNYIDVEDEIVGLSSVKGSPILLGKSSVYRIDGQFDVIGLGGMAKQKISDTASCVSAQSVVQTVEGVFWAGKDGIYFTDGYNVLRLNQDYSKTWATWVASADQRKAIQGKYDSLNRRIWWTIQEAGETDCNRCYVLHLEFGVKEDACFTTASGTNDCFAPTALEFSDAQMIRADRRGYLFRHRSNLYTDPKIDIVADPSDWEKTLLRYTLVSCAFNFGTNFVRKYIPRIDVTCENETNLSLQITSINDTNSASSDLKPIRFRGNLTWGDPDALWGDPTLEWNNERLIDEQRRFPARTLRCEYKQIEMTNAFVAITSSDILGSATVNATAKTVTLDDAAGKDWPSTVVDYFIAFSNDNYSREFLVEARTSDDVLTFADIGNLAVDGSYDWVIRGYPRGEVLSLIGYVIHFALMGKTQDAYRAANSGEVGA